MQTEPNNDAAARQLAIALLNGRTSAWPPAASTGLIKAFESLCEREGLFPLLHHLCARSPDWTAWPAELQSRLRRQAINAAAHELAAADAQARLLEALAAENVVPIVLKGAAIAYTHYAEPGLRSRGDLDLLFRRSDLGAAFGVMERLGYRYQRRPGLLGQELGYLPPPASRAYPLDIHWRPTSYLLLANVLDYDEIRKNAISITSNALGLCAEHALLHACIHLIKHRASGDALRLLWLHDIRLLAASLDAEATSLFVELIRAKRVSRICAKALDLVHQLFPTPELQMLIGQCATIRQNEPSARMLNDAAPDFLLADLAASSNWRHLGASLQDLLFPPGSWLLRLYGKRRRHWLTLLYPHRLYTGALLYLRRQN